jgi:hypothetical protein
LTKGAGPFESEIYALHPTLFRNVRRGNTFLKVYDKVDPNLFKYSMIARKGLRKFFDLKLRYLLDDKSFKHMYNWKNKNTKCRKEAYVESNTRNYIFAPIVEQLEEENGQVELIKTLKVNGENAQISWLEKEGLWWICSKSVSILAKNITDVEYYETEEESRYTYAVAIAKAWFNVLRELKLNKVSIADMKKKLEGKTLVGEYVGNSIYQHLVMYPKETIVFYAITENDSIDNNCMLPEEIYNFFNEFKLDWVPYERIGVFDNIIDLSNALEHEYHVVASSKMKFEEEGAVVYAIGRGTKNDKVLSVLKLKTLEYRIFRKLREKLRHYWAVTNMNKPWTQTEYSKYDRVYQEWLRETKILVKDFHLPHPLKYYQDIVNFAFAALQEDSMLVDTLMNFYVDFLMEIFRQKELDPNNFISVLSLKVRTNYEPPSGNF